MTNPHHQTDIQILPENTGKDCSDYILADLHGNLNVFLAALANCRQPGDRLILAGDFIDRRDRSSVRPDASADIILTILENNSNPDKPKIYCVRGNHEDMCIDTINWLIRLTQIHFYGYTQEELILILYVLKEMSDVDQEMKQVFNYEPIKTMLHGSILLGKNIFNEYFDVLESAVEMTMLEKIAYLQQHSSLLADIDSVRGHLSEMYNAISTHQYNGCQWLIDLYMEELSNTNISASENEVVDFSEDSVVLRIKNYLESLPVTLCVGEDGAASAAIPYIVVHAALPINAEEILRHHAEGIGFTSGQKEYALWARALQTAEFVIKKIPGLNHYSILTIVGHSIDDGVREDTNTINLDVAAYVRDCALVIKMPACQVFIQPGIGAAQKVDDAVVQIAEAAQQQLNKQTALREKRLQKAQQKRLPGLFEGEEKEDGAEPDVTDSAPSDPGNNQKLP